MSEQYTEGPADQRWEVEVDDHTQWVQRVGWNQRNVRTLGQELIIGIAQPLQAQALCDRLNELDRARALIAAIADLIESPDWTHESDSADDGWHIYCQGRSIITTLLEDYDREGPESQVKP